MNESIEAIYTRFLPNREELFLTSNLLIDL